MSDAIAGLLFELYDTNRATAYSNLLVGIVFGELIPFALSRQRDSNGLPPLPFPRKKSVPMSIMNLGFVSIQPNSLHLSTIGAYVVLYGTSLYILL